MKNTVTITVINPVRDARGTVIDWKSVVIDGVHLEHSDAVSTSGTARENADTALLMIWQASTDAIDMSPEEVITALKPGTYIVLGRCEDLPQAGLPLKDFVSCTGPMEIISCEACLYGSYRMRHWEVYAK